MSVVEQPDALTRRTVLSGGAALLLGGVAGTSVAGAANPDGPSLKEIAAARNLQISSAYNGWEDPRLLELLVRHWNVITPENALKAAEISSADGTRFTPDKMDEIADFCGRNSLGLHGHALYWHQSLPAWLGSTSIKDAERAHAKLLRYVMTRYPQIQSWDVVNEPISDHTEGYRENTILSEKGDAFLKFLFTTARQLAPHATLVLNDYNLSCGAAFCDSKRSTLLRTLERLLHQGTPIDALGVQAHLVPRWPVVPKKVQAFLQDVSDLGLDVHVSEMDVNDIDLPENEVERDHLIAQIYKDYLDAVLSQDNVKRIGFWGLTDRFHWIVEGYAPFKRGKGTPRPALFDQDLRPKPAFFAVADALRAAPVRP